MVTPYYYLLLLLLVFHILFKLSQLFCEWSQNREFTSYTPKKGTASSCSLISKAKVWEAANTYRSGTWVFPAPLPFRYKVTFTGCEAAILSAAEDRQTTIEKKTVSPRSTLENCSAEIITRCGGRMAEQGLRIPANESEFRMWDKDKTQIMNALCLAKPWNSGEACWSWWTVQGGLPRRMLVKQALSLEMVERSSQVEGGRKDKGSRGAGSHVSVCWASVEVKFSPPKVLVLRSAANATLRENTAVLGHEDRGNGKLSGKK